MGYISYGAARQYAAVPVDKLARLPADLDLERAAGLNITYGTTYHALRDRAALKAGETLAVLGASGGVGLAAVELGARWGRASSPARRARTSSPSRASTARTRA